MENIQLSSLTEAVPPIPRFMIAISGTACSGKTSLATMLTCILSDYTHYPHTDPRITSPERPIGRQNGRVLVPMISQQLYIRPQEKLLSVNIGEQNQTFKDRDGVEACDWTELEHDFNAVKGGERNSIPKAAYHWPSDIADVDDIKQTIMDRALGRFSNLFQWAKTTIDAVIAEHGPPDVAREGEFPGCYFGRRCFEGASFGRLAVRFGIVEGNLLFAKPHYLPLANTCDDVSIQRRIRDACDIKLYVSSTGGQSCQMSSAKRANQDRPYGTRDPSHWWKRREYFENVTLQYSLAFQMPIVQGLSIAQLEQGVMVNDIHVKRTSAPNEERLDYRVVIWAVRVILDELVRREAEERAKWEQRQRA